MAKCGKLQITLPLWAAGVRETIVVKWNKIWKMQSSPHSLLQSHPCFLIALRPQIPFPEVFWSYDVPDIFLKFSPAAPTSFWRWVGNLGEVCPLGRSWWPAVQWWRVQWRDGYSLGRWASPRPRSFGDTAAKERTAMLGFWRVLELECDEEIRVRRSWPGGESGPSHSRMWGVVPGCRCASTSREYRVCGRSWWARQHLHFSNQTLFWNSPSITPCPKVWPWLCEPKIFQQYIMTAK